MNTLVRLHPRRDTRSPTLTDGLPSGDGASAADGAQAPQRTPGFQARFDAAEALHAGGASADDVIAALLQIANDPTLTPAERARAFVAAGRVAAGEDDSTRAELFYLRATGLDASADANVPGARLLHIAVLSSQGRLADMLPLLDAEIAARSPVTADNRDTVVFLHRTRASVLTAAARMPEALAAIDTAIATARAGGMTDNEPAMMRLRMRRADILQTGGAQLREASGASAADITRGQTMQRESTTELQAMWHHLRDNPGDYDADTRAALLRSVHGALEERVSPRFNAAEVRQPGVGMTRADVTTIQNKFTQAEALYNRAVGRPPGEEATARAELAEVQRLAEEILALDDNDGMAHFMWRAAADATDNLGTPLIAPIDTAAERTEVLTRLTELANQANITVPGAPAPQPRTGQGDAALRQLFPQWDKLSETQRAIVAYEILGYGQLIPRVIEQGAQYNFVGVGSSAALIDPESRPDEFDDEDRAFYAGRGWAYPTPTGHFIVTGVEDILEGGRGGYPTVSHEFAHLVHGTMARAQTEVARLTAAGQPVPADLQQLADTATRIDQEYQRVQDDRPRAIYYEVEGALNASPPRPVDATAQATHDTFLASYQAAHGAGSRPPATPTPPLDQFLDSYSARNSSEFFAQGMMSVLVGGNDQWSRELFTRNPSMWHFSREIADRYRSFPAGFAHGLDHPPVGLNAQGRPTTLAELRGHSSSPHISGEARASLEHLHALHNPQNAPAAPPLVGPRSVAIGDPAAVTHPASRQLLNHVRANDFEGALTAARALQREVDAGTMTLEQYRDATTALTTALARAEEKSEWKCWEIFLTVLLSILVIPGLIFGLSKMFDKREARALRDVLRQEPMARRDEGAWRAAGVEFAQRGGAALANLRATGGPDALRVNLEQQLRAAGFNATEARDRATWMIGGIDAAVHQGLAPPPDPHPESATLSAADRATQSGILLRRAGELAEVDVGSRPLNYLGDQVTTTGAPPTRVWDHAQSDAAIAMMGYGELEAQTRLEIAQIDRELANPGLDATRRTDLTQAKTDLQAVQADLRRDSLAFFGDTSRSPALRPTRPPEEMGPALSSARTRLTALHQTVLGAVPPP